MTRQGQWWLNPQNTLQGECLTPTRTLCSYFHGASMAGWRPMSVSQIQEGNSFDWKSTLLSTCKPVNLQHSTVYMMC